MQAVLSLLRRCLSYAYIMGMGFVRGVGENGFDLAQVAHYVLSTVPALYESLQTQPSFDRIMQRRHLLGQCIYLLRCRAWIQLVQALLHNLDLAEHLICARLI